MTRFLVPTAVAGAITLVALVFGAYVDATRFDWHATRFDWQRGMQYVASPPRQAASPRQMRPAALPIVDRSVSR